MATKNTGRLGKRSNAPTDEKRIAHFIALARETAKQLDTRALLLCVPVLVSAYKINTAATPHIREFEAINERIEKKNEIRRKLSERSVADQDRRIAIKRADPGAQHKLVGEQLAMERELESVSKESQHARKIALRKVKEITIELPLPGVDKQSISLFFAAALVQAFSFLALIYLWSLRRKSLEYLYQARDYCKQGVAQQHAATAAPGSPLLLPLPQAVGVRSLLGAKIDSVSHGFALAFLLLSLALANVWLVRLNYRILNSFGSEITWETFPFLLSCCFGPLVIVFSLIWWFLAAKPDSSEAMASFDRRLFLTLPLVGVVGAFAGACGKSTFRRQALKSIRQIPYRMLAVAPRYKTKKERPLLTDLVSDGFLFNPRSRIWHLVSNRRVSGVQETQRSKKAFKRFFPRDELLQVNGKGPTRGSSAFATKEIPADLLQRGPLIANNKTTMAAERAATQLAQFDVAAALDYLFQFIKWGLPQYRPVRRKALNLRLFDLYARLAVRHYDDRRLELFLKALKDANIAALIPERIYKWESKDSKWRERTQKCGRSSNEGSPAAGKCEFESRPTLRSRAR